MDPQELTEVHDEGRAINARAFAEAEVEIAYHALAMAMHAAQSAKEVEALEKISVAADEQARVLLERARATGGESLIAGAMTSHARIFASLAQQAKTTAIRVSLPGLARTQIR